MKMKNKLMQWAGLSLMILLMISLASCEKQEKEGSVPEVSLEIRNTYDTYVEFAVSAPGASLLTYRLLTEYDALPSASELLKSGTMADPDLFQVYTVRNLEPETTYRIVAAARYADGSESAVREESFRTVASQAIVPALVLRDVVAASTSIRFTLVPDKAARLAYMCVPATEGIPDAETILEEGIQVDPGKTDQYVAAGLASLTEYVIAAVAESVDGTCCDVQSETVETLEPEPVAVGDFYYSDGTWSSGSESPLDGKTVVGVVFKSGAADSDLSDYNAAGIDEIHGFAVALSDVKDNSDPFSPKTGFEWSDSPLGVTSADQDDFSGYYNTVKIMEAIRNIGGSSDVVSYIVDFYDSQVPAPESSTGWYLPSLGQLKELYNVRSEVYAAFDMVDGDSLYDFSGDWYWSSTESGEDGTVYKVNFLDSGLVVESDDIARLWKVRPVLAF